MLSKKCIIFILSTAIIGAATTAPVLATGYNLNQARISRELSLNPGDPLLHYLNGLAYERSAVLSTEERELARIAYRMALRQDFGFWRAAYQLGVMALEDRDAQSAQKYFLIAAVNAPREPKVLRALARASYCVGDIDAAAAALEKAALHSQIATADDLLTSALVASAFSQIDEVNALLPRMSPLHREAMVGRLDIPRLPIEAVDTKLADIDTVTSDPPKMAMVDVVIIRRKESSASTSGINLLDSLSLQLGSSLINRSWAKSINQTDPTLSTDAETAASGFELTIPAVAYSLNIANARGSASRIESRPTLLIYDDLEAKIFDGGTLTFATDGQINSASETREVGMTLSVKPKFTKNDTVNVSVSVALENFDSSSPTGTFKQSVQTMKSATTVSADVRFGQTILISSGTGKDDSSGSSRTPLLGSLPVLGNLFSARSATKRETELLVLLSLRPVPGLGSSNVLSSQPDGVHEMKQRLFPTLIEKKRLQPERRQIFYRIANPAHDNATIDLASTVPAKLLRDLQSR